MLIDRFKAHEDQVAKLPPDQQEALAATLEDALREVERKPTPVASDVRAAIERALERHAASLLYLKDK